jgi:hypothetical protein
MNRAALSLLALGLIADALIVSPACGQIPEGWGIVEIANEAGYYHSGIDLNDHGQVTFHRRLWPSLTDIEIMLYDRGKLVQLTENDVYEAFPRINNKTEIAWNRDLDPDPETERVGIVRWRNGKLHVVSDQPFPETFPDINDDGHIVWDGKPSLPSDRAEIYFYNGQNVFQVTDFDLSSQVCYLNSHGQVAFTRRNFTVSPWVADAFAYLPGLIQLSPKSVQLNVSSINDEPAVVWGTVFSGLQVWRNGTITQILSGNIGGAGLNNRGDMAIPRGQGPGNPTTLWLWCDGELRELAEGAGTAINDRREIAFRRGEFPYYSVALLTRKEFVADLDADGDVDLADFAKLQNCFSKQVTYGEACVWADVTVDGVVDAQDVARLVGYLEGPSDGSCPK